MLTFGVDFNFHCKILESILNMKHIFKIVFIGLIVVGCTKRNCVTTSDLAFDQLDESNRTFYKFTLDSFTISICQYITPNSDGLNDSFEIQSNLDSNDYLSTSFRLVNACEEVVHVDKNSFPFSFPDTKNLEDGQYNFTLSVLLDESKDVISGAGKIRVIRK